MDGYIYMDVYIYIYIYILFFSFLVSAYKKKKRWLLKLTNSDTRA